MTKPARREVSRLDESRHRVRIVDVAAAAGVSIGTVSNTINHPGRVSAATREAVWSAINEMGFIPNQMARVLTGAPSKVIGLIMLDVQSPFFMQLAHSVERAAREEGYAVLLGNSENSAEREIELLTMLTSQRVHGALVTPAGGSMTQLPNWLSLPLVYLDNVGGPDNCSVVVDHKAGGEMAANHLLSLGHETMAFVGGSPNLWQFEQRVEGVRRALVAAGLDPGEALVEVSAEGIGVDSGMAAARLLLESGLPPAIFCGNDMLAFGVFKALTAAKVLVPEDVALVGYDDIEFSANWIVPLSTIRQPTEAMGEMGARLLIEHARGLPAHEHRSVVLQPDLVVRDSCGAPLATGEIQHGRNPGETVPG